MNIFTKVYRGITKGLQDINEKYSLYKSLDDLKFNKSSQKDFLDYNEISMYVNRAIEIRAEKVGCVEFKLKKGDKDIEKDKLYDLLNKPNKFHTGKQFWKLYQKYMDLTGNAFIFIDKKNELFANETLPTAMHLLRPDAVKILFNENNTDIVGYEYNNGKTTDTYNPDQIIYSFNPDPKSPLKGMSLLMAGIRAIETEIQLEEYQAKVLKNGGRVEGVLNFKAALNKTQMKDLKDSYEEEYAGAQKAGRPLFLGGDASYVNVGLNPQELSYLESKKVTLDDICILTGVPKEILGVTSGATYANADASIAIFLREIVKPLLVDLTTFLDWRLVPEDKDLTFIDPTPEDIDKKIKIAKAAHETNCATINEKREMLGMDDIEMEGADAILVPFSLTPLEQAVAEPEPAPEMDPNADPEDDEEQDPPEEKRLKKNYKHPLKDPVFRKKYGEQKAMRMDKREKRFKRAIDNYFADQKERILDHLPTKKFKTKGFLDEMFNPEIEIKLAKNAVIPLLKQILVEAGLETIEMLDYNYNFVFSSAMEKWIDNRSDLLAKEITDTTFKKLKSQFSQAIDANETREQLVRRIQETYTGFNESRARTIARTEVHGATEQGTLDAYKQAGVGIKIWVAVTDDVTRESHAMLDGEEVPINGYFSNGLLMPGDQNGPAEEVINCRCQI